MIRIKTAEELEILREGGKRLSSVLSSLIADIAPGADTGMLEKKARAAIAEAGGVPSFLGFHGFTTALCTSINDELVHAPALPARTLREGDIITIDIGMEYRGLFTDMATTVGVGDIDPASTRLLSATKECLQSAINAAKEGNTLYDIGVAVSACAERYGYSVIRDFVGHGVGHAVHEDPQVPNYPVPAQKNILITKGMVLALEPMISSGSPETMIGSDGWTVSMADGGLCAQEEHTIAIDHTGKTIIITR